MGKLVLTLSVRFVRRWISFRWAWEYVSFLSLNTHSHTGSSHGNISNLKFSSSNLLTANDKPYSLSFLILQK